MKRTKKTMSWSDESGLPLVAYDEVRNNNWLISIYLFGCWRLFCFILFSDSIQLPLLPAHWYSIHLSYWSYSTTSTSPSIVIVILHFWIALHKSIHCHCDFIFLNCPSQVHPLSLWFYTFELPFIKNSMHARLDFSPTFWNFLSN